MSQPINRRQLFSFGAAGAAAFSIPGRFAEQLEVTPSTTEGPFYPDRLPLDTDNDLLVLNDSITPAVGAISHLSGRVLTKAGSPVRNAMVEIWQVDNKGSYLHSEGSVEAGRDPNFQGYGRFLTDFEGRYYFRTIRPVPYPGRVPHIHLAVSANGRRVLTTQFHDRAASGLAKDGVLRRVDRARRELLIADFVPLEGSSFGELSVKFDVVLGETPADLDEALRGGIGKPEQGRRGSRRRTPRGRIR